MFYYVAVKRKNLEWGTKANLKKVDADQSLKDLSLETMIKGEM